MSCDFTFDHYKECLKALRESDTKYYIYHDVDSHLENALKFSNIESEFGMRCCYFIRVHGKYNPFYYPNSKIIKKISENHIVGLHFEPEYHYLNGEDVFDQMANDYDLLYKSGLVNRYLYTTHNIEQLKAKRKYCRFHDFSKVEFDCYDKEENNIKYISDSGGRLREGCMCNFIGKEKILKINTHPTWWFEESNLENF